MVRGDPIILSNIRYHYGGRSLPFLIITFGATVSQLTCGVLPMYCMGCTRLGQPSLSMDRFFNLNINKFENFGEKPFLWKFLLGGDTSKKRIKSFTRKNHHEGSPAPFSLYFASRTFWVAVVHLICIGGIFYRRRSVVCRGGSRSKKGCRVGK